MYNNEEVINNFQKYLLYYEEHRTFELTKSIEYFFPINQTRENKMQ